MRWTTLTVVATIALLCAWGITTQGPAAAGITELEVVSTDLSISPGPSTTGLGKKIEGTWYSYITPPGGVPLLAVFHYTEHGITFGSSTTEGGAGAVGTPFSNTHGAWEKIGGRKIRSTDVVFAYEHDDVGGAWVATYKIIAEVEFDKDYESGHGIQINYEYAPTQNPFDPNEVPVACYGFAESDFFRMPIDHVPDACPDPPGCFFDIIFPDTAPNEQCMRP